MESQRMSTWNDSEMCSIRTHTLACSLELCCEHNGRFRNQVEMMSAFPMMEKPAP